MHARNGNKGEKTEDHEINSKDTACGIGTFQPRCIQPAANIKVMALVLALSVLAFSMDLGISMVTVTNLQKRYGLSSKFIGLYHSLKDVAEIISTIIVAYFGGRPGCHKPRWIACGLVVCSLAYFTESLAQFISEPYQAYTVQIGNDTSNPGLCENNREPAYTTDDEVQGRCSNSVASVLVPTGSKPAILYLIGGIMAGLGNTPLLVLGIPYIDDHVSKKSSPVYLGIIFAILGMGPLIGMPLAGYFTKLYVDFYRVDPDISQGDPRWVGAWWVGHLFTSLLMMIMAIIMLFIPKQMPLKHDDCIGAETKDGGDDAVVQIHATGEIMDKLKDFPKAILRLLTNFPLMMLIIGRAVLLANMGVAVFLPKYIEENFRVTTSLSGLVVGSAIIFPGCLGFLIGGLILRQWKPNKVKMASLLALGLGIGAFLPLILMGIGCPTEQFAGVTVFDTERLGDTTNTHDVGNQLITTCNSHCSCTNNYEPVCGADGITYFSPCYAGCTDYIEKQKNFTQCSCIDNVTTWGNSTDEGTSFSGLCGQSCKKHLLIFAVVFAIISITTSIAVSSEIILVLRCVAPADKSFALGLKAIFSQLIGTLPSPIYAGALVDSACILWGTTECNERGACLQYDLPDYRHKFLGLITSLRLLAVLFFIIAWIALRRNPEPAKSDMRRERPTGFLKLSEISTAGDRNQNVANENSQLMSDEGAEKTTTVTT